VPVIATRVGGIPDVIRHGETGLLVEPGNVDELALNIKRLIKDDHLREKLADNCYEEAKKYSWGCLVKRFENILKEVA